MKSKRTFVLRIRVKLESGSSCLRMVGRGSLPAYMSSTMGSSCKRNVDMGLVMSLVSVCSLRSRRPLIFPRKEKQQRRDLTVSSNEGAVISLVGAVILLDTGVLASLAPILAKKET